MLWTDFAPTRILGNREKKGNALMRLQGRVAIITGAAGGIGAAVARRFAAEGADLCLAGRRGCAAVAAELGQTGRRVIDVQTDVTDRTANQAMVTRALEVFGRVDILVNNAGTSIRKMPQEFTEEEWHHVMDTNLTSAFLCSQAAYHAMVKVGGGKMINIGSMMSLFGAPYATPYASSKGGIVQMTRALATAWAKDHIQVNAVLPGWIDTDLTKRARQQVQGLHDSVEKRTPENRWGVPSDLAGVAAFLASGASDFVTGTAIPVDGGFSIAM